MVSFSKSKLVSLFLNGLGGKLDLCTKLEMAPGEMCPRIFVVYPYRIVTYLNTYQNIFCLLVLLVLSSCVQLVQSGLIYPIDISELTHPKLKTCPSQSQPHLKFPGYLKSSFPS